MLRVLVRRGAVFGAHSTRTTEQSAALLAYWASTTLNTTGCYALAAWRGVSKHAEGELLSRWYADVGVYLLTTLLWEALAPPVGALLRAAFRANALQELYRVRYFFWRRRGHPGAARPPSLGGDEESQAMEQHGLRAYLPSKARPFYDRYVTAPIAQYVAAPPWDPTARCADLLRVFFVGATFGAGMPLLPPLAALTLAAMLAHDKWALLRERRPPPKYGAHLARTAAQIAPVAAPIHCLLALWTWGDPKVTGAQPFFWSKDLFFSASKATWPLAVALACCVVSNVALRAAIDATPLQHSRSTPRERDEHPRFEVIARRKMSHIDRPREEVGKSSAQVALRVPKGAVCTGRDQRAYYNSWASPEPEKPPSTNRDDSFERTNSWTKIHWGAAPSRNETQTPMKPLPPRTPLRHGDSLDDSDDEQHLAQSDVVIVGKHPPWKDAVPQWERTGVAHSYDIFDDPHPLLRTRHLIRRTSVLSSTTATSAASVLALLAEEQARPHPPSDDGLSDVSGPSSRSTSRDEHKSPGGAPPPPP